MNNKDNPISSDSIQSDLEKDAARYRWVKEQKSIRLQTDGSKWKKQGEEFTASHSLASNGTQWGAFKSLDEVIDSAMGTENILKTMNEST
jgi:hypothetical protein